MSLNIQMILFSFFEFFKVADFEVLCCFDRSVGSSIHQSLRNIIELSLFLSFNGVLSQFELCMCQCILFCSTAPAQPSGTVALCRACLMSHHISIGLHCISVGPSSGWMVQNKIKGDAGSVVLSFSMRFHDVSFKITA